MRKRKLDPKQFRDKATLLGCKNAYELSDLAVWQFIIAAQAKS